MKKNFFLTMLFALLSITTGIAQFAPVEGHPYALKAVDTDLYLDIQTTGIKDNEDNIIHLRNKPCIVFFEAGDNGKWKIKNVNGKYVGVGAQWWNAAIGDNQEQWTIIDEGTDGEVNKLSISHIYDGNTDYIGTKYSLSNELGLYNNSEGNNPEASRVYFRLITYPSYNDEALCYYTFKSPDGNLYMNRTPVTVEWNTTQVSFQSTATDFNIIQSVDYLVIEEKANPGNYLGYNHGWLATIETSYNNKMQWLASDDDGNGLVIISRAGDAGNGGGKNLGSDSDNIVVGTGIFSNVGGTCKEWEIEKHNMYSLATRTPTVNQENQLDVIKNNNQFLDALTLNGVKLFSGISAPTSGEEMYVIVKDRGVILEPGSTYTFKTNRSSIGCVANLFFDKDGDGEFETKLGVTGAADDGSNNLTTVSFTVPADAEEGLTAIRFRLDSSWGIATSADDPNSTNRMVYDIPVTITLPSSYTFNIVNPSGETVTATYNGNAINEGEQINGGVNESLFSANDIEGYAWSIVVDNSAKTVTLVYVKKYTFSLVDVPNGVTITFDGNAVNEGDYIETVFDAEKLTITGCPNNYKWEFTNDTENKKIIIEFTELVTDDNPQPVIDLLNRIGGAGTADKFKIVLDPSLNSYGAEQFVIGNEDGKILIKGSTLSAITTGIGWYLQNIAHINIAWNSLNEKTVSGDAYADLSSITAPASEEVHTTDAEYRYYLNYCTFGYSMTSWTWERWQQEIDWMALHGINMPLQIIGLEEVWRKFLTMEDGSGTRKYNYTDAEAKAFVAGPAYTAWWGMNNLEGYGGTNADGKGGVQDDEWYTRQQQLATLILTRQRDLGMQPVLPGFSGMVPTNFTTKTTIPTDANGGSWSGFARPRIIDPTNERFAEIAADYYKCLKDVMGESQYYSMDPFHEGGKLSSIPNVDNEENRNSYKTAYKAVYDAMEIAKPGSQWVIQQWQWYWYQKVSVNAVPNGRMIVLDLFSDGSPAFDSYNGYAPQEAVFCAIPNFGGRSGLMGRLQNVTDNYFNFKVKYSSIKGIGAAPEAIEQTPVTYDLIFQLPWMNGVKPDVEEWVNNYAIARYGVNNNEIKEAWSLLRQGPLNYGADGIQGPIEDVWAARPNLEANYASSWGSTLSKSFKGYNVQGTYTAARRQMLIDATYKLISQSSAIAPRTIYESNYNYDLVEFGGAVLADYAHYLLLGIGDAKNAAGNDFNNNETYTTRRDAFLQLIRDVDTFKGTNLNFRLGKWTQEARDAAEQVNGATTATPDWYEYNNARTLITTWGDSENNGNGDITNGLKDYSYRSWQGLLKDYYLPRWEYYFNNGCTHPNDNAKNYFYFEWNWAHGKEHYVGQTAKSDVALTADKAGHTDSYTREPEGKTVEVATEVLGKYIIPVVSNTGTYYAYRYLTNDLSAVCTVIADAGQTIDLSTYFGGLTNVSITGDFIDGAATDIEAVTVKADATDGSHTGTITLTDGTVLTFTVIIDPPYNGVYKLALKTYMNGYGSQNAAEGADLFIAYNENTSSSNSVGYKLIASTEGNYQSSVEADEYFTITPVGSGFTLSAQGMYVNAPNLSAWRHIAASENSGEAGVYLIEETTTGIVKLTSVNTGSNELRALNAWDGNNKFIIGNDGVDKYSTFTIAEVTTYPVNIPATGLPINLPFNVVLPEGVTAYDVVEVGYNEIGNKVYETTELATADGVVKAGTPMILKATAAGDYTLRVTINNYDAVGSKSGSLLRGNFLKKKLAVSNSVNRYTFADAQFTRITAETELAGNSVYMELVEAVDTPIAEGVISTTEKPAFIFTTDESNPVLYNIYHKRTGKVMGYDYAQDNVDIVAKTSNNTFQAWYFMAGTDGAVLIKPYNGNGKVLGANDTSNGKNKLLLAADATHKNWTVELAKEENGEQYFYIKTNGTFVNDFENDTVNIGFWNGANASTDGSLFKFIEAEFENNNPRYYQLKDFLATKQDGSQLLEDVEPGCTPGSKSYHNAYMNAKELVGAGNTAAAEECYNAYIAMRRVEYPTEPMIMPVHGAVYRIKSFVEKVKEDDLKKQVHYVAVNEHAGFQLLQEAPEGNSALWICYVDGDKYKFVSALGTAAFGFRVVAETEQEYTITAGTAPGALNLYGTAYLAMRNEDHDKGLGFDQGIKGQHDYWSTDWYLETVGDISEVGFTKIMPEGNHFATMYLPYNVTVPAGVKAYTATIENKDKDENGDDKTGYISLVEIDGDIIPARTAVVLHRESNTEAAEFTFNYTETANDAYNGNLFGGRITTGYVGSEPGQNDDDIYYLLLNSTKGEALYKMYREYNANGRYIGENNGGYIRCEANKGYMKLTGAAPSSYSFRFPGTTAIEEVKGENGNVKAIYDLQGRKLSEITEPGIYIIDGKKVLVK